MDHKDLDDMARNSTEDFYALLGVTFDATPSEIKRQYRKTSIKYHPDKNPDNASAADLFIRLGLARDILLDENLKSVYDNARTRRRERELQNEMLDSRRRKMKEDLERREKEVGERRREMGDMERERERLAEDTRRRRYELSERWRREREEEERKWQEREKEILRKRAREELSGTGEPMDVDVDSRSQEEEEEPQNKKRKEVDSTIKLSFQRQGDAEKWDDKTLAEMFARYGAVEAVVLGKDRKARVEEGDKHRAVLATAYVAFERISAALAAVLDAKTDFPLLESVAWAGEAPELKTPRRGQYPVVAEQAQAQAHKPSNPPADADVPSNAAQTAAPSAFSPKTLDLWELTMMRLRMAEKKRLEGAVKLESKRRKYEDGANAQGRDTPAKTTAVPCAADTPDLHEITMMRLKQAEKKRLEEEIRRQEAEEEGEV